MNEIIKSIFVIVIYLMCICSADDCYEIIESDIENDKEVQKNAIHKTRHRKYTKRT